MSYRRVLLRAVLALTLMGWGQFVIADDYYWYLSTAPGVRDSTALAACMRRDQGVVSAGYSKRYYTSGPVMAADGSATCQYDIRRDSNGNLLQTTSITFLRGGDGCTAPAVYNSATGACEAPEPDKCESTAGQSINHEHQTYNLETGQRIGDPPGSICENACQYAFSGEAPSDCYRFIDGSKSGGFCKYRYQGNGVSCTGGDTSNPGSVFDQPPSKPAFKPDPAMASDSKCDAWTTNPDGTLSRSCTATSSLTDPGTMKCEGASCTAGKPSPKHSETKVEEATTTTTNADNSTTTTTTTTTETTNCTGTKPCTTTTKTETTTSGTNPDGTPGDESYECQGSACGKDGDGGLEDGEEEETEERTAAAGNCDADLQCSGDPIDCAILQQQKEQRCLAEEMGDFEGNKSDIEGLLQGDKFELSEGSGDIDVPSFITQGTRFLPASCPPAETFSLTLAGGRTFALSFEPLCRAASDLSGLFVAVATIFAALYVGRAVGGQ